MPHSVTGVEMVDQLQGLQKIADVIDDPDRKIAHVRNTLRIINARSILGHRFMVSASSVFARQEGNDISSERILFNDGLFFVGKLDLFTYLLDRDVPVDSLAMNFEAPEVMGVDPEDAIAFRTLSLQVPVLAIDSCMDAQAA